MLPQFLWLTLVAGGGGTCIPGPHRTLAIREMVLKRLPPPGHCVASELNPQPPPQASLSVKEASLPSWRLRLGTLSSGDRVDLRNTGSGCCLDALPLPCSRLLVFIRKELIHSSGAPSLFNCHPGPSPYLLAWVASGAYTCDPKVLYIF